MEIDLAKILAYSKDCLQSRAKMRSIMLDMYPGKTRDMNVLLAVYESGVPKKIRNERNITDAKYAQYVQNIIDDYGIQEQWVVTGLNAWIDVCLGKGTASTIKYHIPVSSTNSNTIDDTVRGDYTNPIVHNTTNNRKPCRVNGKVSDYDVKDLGNGVAEIIKYKGFDVEETIVPTEIKGLRIIGIGEGAYEKCLGMKRLIIPEGIEYILDGAFMDCNNLIEVVFPTTLKKLGNEAGRWSHGAFQNTKVKSVNLPNDLQIIGHCAFCFCGELETVALPDNLRIIGSHAFAYCSKLQNLELSEGLERIEDDVFNLCINMKEITIPSTVNFIGKDALPTVSSSFKVRCYPGSIAIDYCRANRIIFENATS